MTDKKPKRSKGGAAMLCKNCIRIAARNQHANRWKTACEKINIGKG